MQPAIGSTCRSDKQRAGRVQLLLGEGRAGKTLCPCVCGRAAGEEGGAGSQHAQVAAALDSLSLPAHGTSCDFTRRLKEEIKLSERKCFFSPLMLFCLCVCPFCGIYYIFHPTGCKGFPLKLTLQSTENGSKLEGNVCV